MLAALGRSGELRTVGESVSPVFELAAYLEALDPGPAVLFADVRGSGVPVVGNVLGSRQRIATALGVPIGGIQGTITAAIGARGGLEQVERAPCQELVAEADLTALPVPHFFEREGGPYLTDGVIIARDPVTGEGNASFARVRPLGGRRALVGIAPNHHLNRMAHRAPDGRLDIAVVLGAPPAVQLAACLYLELGDDELFHVEPLLGAPLRVTPSVRAGLPVPSDAEIVLEGVLDVRDVVEEGEVSEYHGLYECYGAAATAEFHTVTSRSDPMLQVVLPGRHLEHIYLGALPIAAGLREAVARTVHGTGEVAVTEAGGGRLAAVIALHDPRPGQAKQAMFAAWGALSMLKQVTVVDPDIDVWDPVEVEWARITRCRIDEDLVVVGGVRTDRSEPLERGGTVTKIGYDALAREGDRAEGFGRAAPPPDVVASVRARLGDVR